MGFRLISAVEYMQGRPHFITWEVHGSTRTGTLCFPTDNLPFELHSVIGFIDEFGRFRSKDCPEIRVGGYRLRSIQIEPDVETIPEGLLTQSEQKVFESIGNGMTTRQISESLSLTTKTVKTYGDRARRKLSFRSSHQMADYATKWVSENACG